MLANCGKMEPSVTKGQLAIGPAHSQSPADVKMGFDGPDVSSESSFAGIKTLGLDSILPPGSTKSEPIDLTSPVVSIATPMSNGNHRNGLAVKNEPVVRLDTKHVSSDVLKINIQHETNGLALKQTIPSSPIIQA
jgi:hypothetical protein